MRKGRFAGPFSLAGILCGREDILPRNAGWLDDQLSADSLLAAQFASLDSLPPDQRLTGTLTFFAAGVDLVGFAADQLEGRWGCSQRESSKREDHSGLSVFVFDKRASLGARPRKAPMAPQPIAKMPHTMRATSNQSSRTVGAACPMSNGDPNIASNPAAAPHNAATTRFAVFLRAIAKATAPPRNVAR